MISRYEHDDLIVVFSAGNDGNNGAQTVNSPGLAKNVVTVGAAGSRYSDVTNSEDYVTYYSSRGDRCKL